jgi:hypothetical protein
MKIKAIKRTRKNLFNTWAGPNGPLFTEDFAAVGGTEEKLRLLDLFSRKSAKEFYSSMRCLNNATAASFTPSPTF